MTTGPCSPWCTVTQMVDGWTPPTGASTDMKARAVDAASEACFELGGRRWAGSCTETIVPALIGCGDAGFAVWPLAGNALGIGPRPMVDLNRSGMSLDVPLLDLGAEPVTAIGEVRLSGTPLATTAYTLVNGRYVLRRDGGGWPMPYIATTPPSIEVDFTYGEAPPSLGVEAAIALARELVLLLADADGCQLNRRVRNVVREGVSIDIAVPGLIDSLRDGYTGIPAVDLFVGTMNPEGLRRAARVIIPGQSFPTRLG